MNASVLCSVFALQMFEPSIPVLVLPVDEAKKFEDFVAQYHLMFDWFS